LPPSFAVNTFRFTGGTSTASRSWLVRFHIKPRLGVHCLVWDEAQELRGRDPDFLRRDLWEAIATGNYPQYEVGVQMLPDDEGDKAKRAETVEVLGFDPLDPTKFWPEEIVPVRFFGTLTLNRNVDDFHAETEQVAFCPGNLVPGIELSDDPILQVRAFSYLDTQLTRLGGPNFNQIPINRARGAVVSHNQRGGLMQTKIASGRVSYNPSMLPRPETTAETNAQPFKHTPALVHGVRARVPFEPSGRLGADEHAQARQLYLSFAQWERVHVMDAFCYELSQVPELAIRAAIVNNFLAFVDPALSTAVAKFLGVPPPTKTVSGMPEGCIPSPALSLEHTVKSAATRKVAVVAADGFDGASLKEVLQQLVVAGAAPVYVSCTGAARIVSADADIEAKAPLPLSSTPSVFFDAVLVAGGVEKVPSAAAEVAAFVHQAFRHYKPIGVEAAAVAKLLPGWAQGQPGVVVMDGGKRTASAFVEAVAAVRHWARSIVAVQEP